MINQPLANERGLVHFDESGAKGDRTLYWIHLARNSRFTHYLLHAKRGVEAMAGLAILPGFKETAVHDRWEPHYNYTQCKRALCGSHLLRDLGAIEEQEKETWATEMKALLQEMCHAVQVVYDATRKGQKHFNTPTVNRFEEACKKILRQGYRHSRGLDLEHGPPTPPPTRGRPKPRLGKNLQDALRDHRAEVRRFI